MKLVEIVKNNRLATGIGVVLVLVLVARGIRSSSDDSAEAEAPTIVPVSVTPIVLTTLRGYVDAWGTVEPEPASEGKAPASARVATPVSGIVASVKCAEGQRVERGAILFTLDSRVADIAVTRAKQAFEFAEQTFARQQKLGPGEATSQKLFQEAEQNLSIARNELATAETQRALLNIAAPLAGTVIKVHAKPGDAVDLTSGLAEVIDLDRLVVTTGVRSVDVASVRRGEEAKLTTESPGSEAQRPAAKGANGRVVFVGAQIDSTTDHVSVRVSIPTGAGFRPGQLLRARIAVEERRNRLAVPVESIVSRGGVSTIAVVEGDKAVQRPVTVGLRDGNLVEVAGEGLRAGQTVVTTGAYGLPNESRIRVVVK
jgi:membrane fusion protein (multidrug efflux system)